MARYDPDPAGARRRLRVRRRIEHAIGQLVERLGLRRIRVMDLWRLEHRIVRKILGRTTRAWLHVRAGHPPLHLARLTGQTRTRNEVGPTGENCCREMGFPESL